ncbi:MAG: D-glycero-beta-D-manno-heptose 1,7-bisphosphate 7-phosphatase [Dehalococcoidales bacterium]|nr:D-glycero-beta-D-manno-heptose 1,7-bisphosphate 7-phosphatase [Dehalococcoidales bacterium]
MNNKAVFLDRDGTIAKDVPYCKNPEQLHLFPDAAESIRNLNEAGYKVILVTNQSGIGRGFLTEEDLARVHRKMKADLQKSGATIDDIYYCPHHPDEHCNCRKPNSGMLEKAITEHEIDISNSFFIGDKYTDMEAANSAGVKAILVPRTEPELHELHERNGFRGTLDFVSPEISGAARWVLSNSIKADDLSIVIPTMNEENNLPHVLPYLPKDAELILVDGHSKDKTIEAAKKLRPDIVILIQTGKGKGNAMRQGFSSATRDLIITYDADGSFRTEEIESYISPLRNGYDMVKGSRFLQSGGTKDMPRLRRFGNSGFTTLTNILFGTGYTDLAYGYHAFRRDILDKVEFTSDGFEIDTEMYIRTKKAGLKVKEVPSFENERIYGEGKLSSFSDGWRILKTILKEKFFE